MHRWWTRKLLAPMRHGHRLHRLRTAAGRHALPVTAAAANAPSAAAQSAAVSARAGVAVHQ